MFHRILFLLMLLVGVSPTAPVSVESQKVQFQPVLIMAQENASLQSEWSRYQAKLSGLFSADVKSGIVLTDAKLFVEADSLFVGVKQVNQDLLQQKIGSDPNTIYIIYSDQIFEQYNSVDLDNHLVWRNDLSLAQKHDLYELDYLKQFSSDEKPALASQKTIQDRALTVSPNFDACDKPSVLEIRLCKQVQLDSALETAIQ